MSTVTANNNNNSAKLNSETHKSLTNRISSAPLEINSSRKKFQSKFKSNSFTSLATPHKLVDFVPAKTESAHIEPLERFTVSYVIKRGYFNLVRYLLSLGLDPNHVDPHQSLPEMYPPLIYCTFIKDEKWALGVAQTLLEYGADLKKTDVNKLNPIHYCCAFGLENLLSLFLKSVDFDLSKALDSNGNNCMHYAIRSHNLNCVKLIIEKFKPNEMYKRIDIQNSKGLRPSQIEDECDYSSIKYFNYKFSGNDSLNICKLLLVDFVREYSILKAIKILKSTVKPTEPEDSKLKVGASKSKKSRSSKQKSKKSATIPNEKSEFKSTFFQTEIEPILEERVRTRSRSVSSASKSSSSPKPRKKKSSKSSKKESVQTPLNEMQDETSSQSDIYETIIFKPDETPIDIEKAKNLTSISFIITLKERLSKLINFSSLFISREHMFQSIIINSSKSEQNRLKNFTKINPIKPIENEKQKLAEVTLAVNEQNQTWKTKLPILFSNMEHLLTPSYRDTVQQTIVSASFLKKRLKKSTKKSSDLDLDKISSQKVNSKRIASSKMERNPALLEE